MSYSAYQTWSSRLLINFIWAVMLLGGRLAFAAYMSVSMYIGMKAMILLWSKGNDANIKRFIIAVFMLFPFRILYTAGWIATSTSYYGPVMFALMSLVPIRKAYDQEKIRKPALLFYSVCLIYGANTEQTCIVLLSMLKFHNSPSV